MKNYIKYITLIFITILSFSSCEKDEVNNLTVESIEVYSGYSPTKWTQLDISKAVGQNYALATLKISNFSSSRGLFAIFRQNGDTSEYLIASGTNIISLGNNSEGQAIIYTDSNGIIEWKADDSVDSKIEVMAFVK